MPILYLLLSGLPADENRTLKTDPRLYWLKVMERLFSTYQVAELLGVTTPAVMNWMRQGLLTYQQLPQGAVRVSERQLVSFLRGQGVDLDALMAKVALSEHAEQPQAHEDQTSTPVRGWAQLLKGPSQQLTADVGKVRQQKAISEVAKLLAMGETQTPETRTPHTDTRALPSPTENDFVTPTTPDAPKSPRTACVGPEDAPPPGRAAQQVLEAILRDAFTRRAQAVQLTYENDELALAMRIDGRLQPRPNFQARLPQGLGCEIVRYTLQRAKLSDPAPLASGSMTFCHAGDDHEISVSASRIAATTRLVLSLPCEPLSVGDCLPSGPARAMRELLTRRSGLVLLAGPAARTRDLLSAARVLLQGRGRHVMELPRTVTFEPADLTNVLTRTKELVVDAIVVEEFADFHGPAAAMEACRRALVLAAVPEDDLSGLVAFLARADLPPWDLARCLSGLVALHEEGGTVRVIDAATRQKIRDGKLEELE